MRNRLLGAVAARLAADRPVDASGAYKAGQMAGLIFAALLIVVGLFYLIKGGGSARTTR